MNSRHILIITAGMLVLLTGRSFAPPLPQVAATAVTVTIPGINTANTMLVSLPVSSIAESEQNSVGNYRSFSPGIVTYAGHLVLERTWDAGTNDWKVWFDGVVQNPGGNWRKNVSLAFSSDSGPVQTQVWNDCIPARYQILPGTGVTVKERLYLKTNVSNPTP